MAYKTGNGATARRLAVAAGLALLCIVFVRPLAAQSGASQMMRATASFPGGQHTIAVGDVLRVRIWGWPRTEDTTEGSFPVEGDGAAYLPVIGRIQVAGRSAEDVQRDYRKRFEVEQRNPVVTVSPIFAVSVVGEVYTPGVVDAYPGYTVFDAVSMAGGFRENSKRNTFLLVRKGQTQVVKGGNAEEGAALMASTALESGDRIVILRSKAATLPIVSLAAQVLIGIATLVTLSTR